MLNNNKLAKILLTKPLNNQQNKELKIFHKRDLAQITLRWLWNIQNVLKLKPLEFLDKLEMTLLMPS